MMSLSRRSVALLVLALVLAACSSSAEVEQGDADVDAAAESTETTADGEAVDDENETEAAPTTDTTTAVEEETDAMGEEGSDEAPPSTIAGDEAVPGTTLPPLSSSDLAAALEASTGDAFGLPFMYLTVEQECDGCAASMSLYYVPGEPKPSILTLAGAFIDGVEQPDFSSVAETLRNGDPRWIAEQLDRADATFGIDPRSGAISTWSVPGETVTIRCLQVDTRPIDMRTERCENSVIG